MSNNDILSQDEVDALLNGMGSGGIEAEIIDESTDDDVRPYNFDNEERIIRGQMPTLEMINKRFSRYLRISLFDMLHQTAEISANSIQLTKFSEYTHTLFSPTSLNVIQMKPLNGFGLVVFDPMLVFSILDSYFGGGGRFQSQVERREFTSTELSLIKKVLDLCFKDLKKAWSPVMDIDFEFSKHESNPQFANVVSPSEVIVVSSFHIELEGGGGGEIHVTLPYSMIEPIRDLLDAGVQSDSSSENKRWKKSMREEVLLADITLSAEFTQIEMNLKKVLALNVGDILPITMPKSITAKVEGISMFETSFGEHDGKKSLKINEVIEHSRENMPQLILSKNKESNIE